MRNYEEEQDERSDKPLIKNPSVMTDKKPMQMKFSSTKPEADDEVEEDQHRSKSSSKERCKHH